MMSHRLEELLSELECSRKVPVGNRDRPEPGRARCQPWPGHLVCRKIAGREGVTNLVERTCAYARQFADGLTAAGFTVLNDVVLNQVLVTFGDAQATLRVISAIQADGTCWCGSTVWQGKTAMRISVSSWATNGVAVRRSLEAMIRVARAETSR